MATENNNRPGKPGNRERIQKYLKILKKDPRSPLFVNLADALMADMNFGEALKWVRAGLKYHPKSVSGLILEGRIHLKMNNPKDGIDCAERALSLANDNLLAYQIKGDAYLQMHDQKGALQAYKMLLFLSPHHERAQVVVKKLESLSAEDYDDEIFAMKKIEVALPIAKVDSESKKRQQTIDAPGFRLAASDEIDRSISLIDAFIARNDIERAGEMLLDAEREYGAHPEFTRRKKILKGVGAGADEKAEAIKPIIRYPRKNREDKIKILETLLSLTRQKAQMQP